VFDEWDGVMHYYSGKHLIETGRYKGWASHFWPPLQSLLISLGNPLLTGKLVAVFSGIIVLFSANSILLHFYVSKYWRSLIIVSLMSLPFFIRYFSIVENHALETAFYLLTISFYFKFKASKHNYHLIICSILCAAAGLVRYTSYTLALAIGIFLLLYSARKSKNFFIFSAVFIFVSSIWWIPNYLMNGSPLATWQYLNVGSHVATMHSEEWWWGGQNEHEGFLSIITTYPSEYIQNFLKNIIMSIALIFSSLSALQITLAIVPFLIAIKLAYDQKEFLNNNDVFFVMFSIVLYILLCSTAFVFFEALLPVIILSVLILYTCLSKYKNNKLINISIYTFLLLNLIGSYVVIDRYLKDQSTTTQLFEYDIVTKAIKEDSKTAEATIMSIHPAHGFYTQYNWIIAPLAGVNNICDVLKYNVSDKVFNYAPKSNINAKRENLFIDYLIITRGLAKRWAFVNEDLEITDHNECPIYLREVYRSEGVAVYSQN
jgi:hypothetical protein